MKTEHRKRYDDVKCLSLNLYNVYFNSTFGAFFRYFFPVSSLSLLPNALLLTQQLLTPLT